MTKRKTKVKKVVVIAPPPPELVPASVTYPQAGPTVDGTKITRPL